METAVDGMPVRRAFAGRPRMPGPAAPGTRWWRGAALALAWQACAPLVADEVPRTGSPDPAARPVESAEPPPALPGRGGRRPALPVADAVSEGDAALARARSAALGGDKDEAVQQALRAFSLAAPHAAADKRCLEVCGSAAALIETLARRQARPADVPTRFE